eukprot:g4848.t1
MNTFMRIAKEEDNLDDWEEEEEDISDDEEEGLLWWKIPVVTSAGRLYYSGGGLLGFSRKSSDQEDEEEESRKNESDEEERILSTTNLSSFQKADGGDVVAGEPVEKVAEKSGTRRNSSAKSSTNQMPSSSSSSFLGTTTAAAEPTASKSSRPREYTPLSALILTINYILGVGCLGVPYAFQQAGWALSAATLLLTCALSMCTVMWVSEVVARAQALARLPCERHANGYWACLAPHGTPTVGTLRMLARIRQRLFLSPPSFTALSQGLLTTSSMERAGGEEEEEEEDCYEAALRVARGMDANGISPSSTARDTTTTNNNNINNNDDENSSFPPDKSYEVTELALKFLGQRGKMLYQISLMILMYAGLLAYAQVFVSSVRLVLPSVVQDVWYLDSCVATVFALLVVPLSTAELTEQVVIQATMALSMQVAMLAIVVSCVVCLFLDDVDNNYAAATSAAAPYYAPTGIHTADVSSLGLMLSTALFSQLFQHSVPGLIRPLPRRYRNGKTVRKVFGGALVTTSLLYLGLGFAATLYFGDTLKSSVNLNWDNFRWGLPDDKKLGLFAKIANRVIILVPAFNTVSVFPLIAITLGNNLHVSMHAAVWKLTKRGGCCGATKTRRKRRRKRKGIRKWKTTAQDSTRESDGVSSATLVSNNDKMYVRSHTGASSLVSSVEEDADAALSGWMASRPNSGKGRRSMSGGYESKIDIDSDYLSPGEEDDEDAGGKGGSRIDMQAVDDTRRTSDDSEATMLRVARQCSNPHHDHHHHHPSTSSSRRRTAARRKISEREEIRKFQRRNKNMWRLLAALPPVVAAAFVKDLSMTFVFSGLPALFVACVGPALLQYYSGEACMRALGSKRTKYSWHFSKLRYVGFVLVFSLGMSVVVVMQLAENFG